VQNISDDVEIGHCDGFDSQLKVLREFFGKARAASLQWNIGTCGTIKLQLI